MSRQSWELINRCRREFEEAWGDEDNNADDEDNDVCDECGDEVHKSQLAPTMEGNGVCMACIRKYTKY